MEDYLILRAGPRFRIGSGISVELEAAMWRAFHDFLARSNLLSPTAPAFPSGSLDDFQIRSGHVTEKGIKVLRCGLDKWMRRIDNGKDPSDVSVLETCLLKVEK